MQRRLTAKFSGSVQGVGFRQFIASRGKALSLVGKVKNNPDGTVSLVAKGDEAKLKQLLAAAKSKKANVVSATYGAAAGGFSGFATL